VLETARREAGRVRVAYLLAPGRLTTRTMRPAGMNVPAPSGSSTRTGNCCSARGSPIFEPWKKPCGTGG
jgi:hypothetical protein